MHLSQNKYAQHICKKHNIPLDATVSGTTRSRIMTGLPSNASLDSIAATSDMVDVSSELEN